MRNRSELCPLKVYTISERRFPESSVSTDAERLMGARVAATAAVCSSVALCKPLQSKEASPLVRRWETHSSRYITCVLENIGSCNVDS